MGRWRLADRDVEIDVRGGGDVADQCLVVAMVAGFGTVVGCGLGMRFMLWWLLGLVHVFALSFGGC